MGKLLVAGMHKKIYAPTKIILMGMLVATLFWGCKKTSIESYTAVAENISISEIKAWSKWYESSIDDAPKMKLDKIQKKVWKGRFFVRVPLENSQGMIYFTKTPSLQAVFIRQNNNNKSSPNELSNTELIDLNARTIRTITYTNNKADSIYTFVPKQAFQTNSRYTTMSGTFWQDLGCLLTFGIPYWSVDGSRQCAGIAGIDWGAIGTWLVSFFNLPETDSPGDGIPFDFASILGNYPQWTYPNNPGDGNSPYFGGGGYGGGAGNTNWQAYTELSSLEILQLNIPSLDAEQIAWLSLPHNSIVANQINTILSEFDEITEAEVRATKIAIDFHMAGIENNYTDAQGASIIAKYLTEFNALDPTDPIFLKYMIWSSMEAAVLKKQHPTWSSQKILIHSQSQTYHAINGLLMLNPATLPVGIGLDAILYSYEGDGKNAVLGVALAGIPAAAGGRFLVRNAITPLGKSINLWALEIGNLITFSNTGILRKAIGLTSKFHQAHHMVSLKLSSHPIVQAAAKSLSRFHISEAKNGVPLLTELNQSTAQHNIYTNYISVKLDEIERELNLLGLTNTQFNAKAAEKLDLLLLEIKEWFRLNENVPIGQINF